MELSPDQQYTQKVTKRIMQRTANEAGVSLGQAAAWALSPTVEGFFTVLRPYTETEDEREIDLGQVQEEWGSEMNPAAELMLDVRIYDLVEERPDGKLYITALGREAMQHLPNHPLHA